MNPLFLPIEEMTGKAPNPIMVFVTRGSRRAQQCPSFACCSWLSGQLLTTTEALFRLAQAGKQKHGENISYSDKIKCKPCSDERHKEHSGFHSRVCALLLRADAALGLLSSPPPVCPFVCSSSPLQIWKYAGVLPKFG